MKQIIIFLSIALASCATQQHIHSTGQYIITTATPAQDGYQVLTFKNYAGRYKILADTLAAGDTIKLNVIGIKRR
jgi:hypothetical protein